MADFDVAAVALASPPASAPLTDYRPGIAVHNLGIESADVTGYLNMYDRATGLLVQTFNLAASDIAPGETRTASASTLWEPTEADVGKHFLFTGYVNYPKDQILSNNQLQPVDVLVTAEAPPPPPPVEAHASQHEDGGSDELDVEGLTGKLAEAQTPTEHASNHESGGADELSVADLTGLLATPQTPTTHASSHQTGGSDPITGIPPAAHKTNHQDGGSDELSVAGLSGELADVQKPKAHKSSHDHGGADALLHFARDGVHDTTGALVENIPSFELTLICSASITMPSSSTAASGILALAQCLVRVPANPSAVEYGQLSLNIAGQMVGETQGFQTQNSSFETVIPITLVGFYPNPGAAPSLDVRVYYYGYGASPHTVSCNSIHALILV